MTGVTGAKAPTQNSQQPRPIDQQADRLIAGAARHLGGTRYVDTETLARAVHTQQKPELTAAVQSRLSPVEQGNFSRALDRAGGQANGLSQILGANDDFLRNYNDMRAANTIGADTYFHCKANFEAAQRGPYGAARADFVSDAREWFDQNVKGDPASASAADQAANDHGRLYGSLFPGMMGREACNNYRPTGLDAQY